MARMYGNDECPSGNFGEWKYYDILMDLFLLNNYTVIDMCIFNTIVRSG